jgi:diguanylate cyclase (GGDEF)-like protein
MKKIDFIKTVPLFSLMSGLELEAVMEFLEPRIIPKGETVFEEGDAGTEMYIVHTGSIGAAAAAADGQIRNLKPFGPKQFFGEMALIAGESRAITCRALEDTKVFVLSGLGFYRMVWDTPMLGVKFLKAMDRIKIEQLSRASGFLDDMVRWGETARRRAVTDDLSGLFNRRFLEEAIATRFYRDFGTAKSCAILMIDFDRFREINGRYGAMAGDAVISNVGATIQRIVGDTYIASRLSGDEFAIFLPDAGAAEAAGLATRLQEETASLFLEFRAGATAKAERVNLTLSIGVAACPEHAKDQRSLFDAADRALYRAKENGRNQVCAP